MVGEAIGGVGRRQESSGLEEEALACGTGPEDRANEGETAAACGEEDPSTLVCTAGSRAATVASLGASGPPPPPDSLSTSTLPSMGSEALVSAYAASRARPVPPTSTAGTPPASSGQAPAGPIAPAPELPNALDLSCSLGIEGGPGSAAEAEAFGVSMHLGSDGASLEGSVLTMNGQQGDASGSLDLLSADAMLFRQGALYDAEAAVARGRLEYGDVSAQGALLDARSNVAVRGDDGSVGLHAGASYSLISGAVTVGDVTSLTLGTGIGGGARFGVGVRDRDGDGQPELCARGGFEAGVGVLVGVCAELTAPVGPEPTVADGAQGAGSADPEPAWGTGGRAGW